MPRGPKVRNNGEGSIYQYPEGTKNWYAQVTLPNGRIKRKRAETLDEARAALAELIAKQKQGIKLGGKQSTVAQWCDIWLSSYAKHLKPNIRDGYQGYVRRYIHGTALGRQRLDNLTHAHVQDWIDELGERVAPQTVKNAHARLHRALAIAVKRQYVVRNVADGVDLPKIRNKEIEPLSFEQSIALLQVATGHRWYALYRLALNLGLRQAELLGLTWDCVDFPAKKLWVKQQLQRAKDADGKGKFILQTTKTKAGERVFDLDDDILAVLREHKRNQTEEQAVVLRKGQTWRDLYTNRKGLIFVSETGAPIHGTMLLEHFRQLLAAAELPRIRFHDLRHTAATLMLADGVPMVTVSKILGHSTPTVTAAVYAHALDTSKADAIAGLSQRLRRNQ